MSVFGDCYSAYNMLIKSLKSGWDIDKWPNKTKLKRLVPYTVGEQRKKSVSNIWAEYGKISACLIRGWVNISGRSSNNSDSNNSNNWLYQTILKIISLKFSQMVDTIIIYRYSFYRWSYSIFTCGVGMVKLSYWVIERINSDYTWLKHSTY